MDLRQLRYFVGIVQAGSLARAAAQLRIAQSALSHHLANLEAELGRQLVTRGAKGIILTEPGTVLYRHAEAILRHLECAKQDTANVPNGPSGRVSVGFPISLVALLGYELLLRTQSAYPHIVLHLTDANSSLLRERLVNGRLDIAMLFTAQPERGLSVEPLLLEELFYVTTDPDPSPITIADLARRPLLLAGPGSAIQRVVQSAFEKHGLTAAPISEIDMLSTLCRAVASGVGSTVLPWSALYDPDDRRVLNHRRIADVKLMRPVAICFSQIGQRGPAVEAVALILKTLVRDLVEHGTWQGVSLIAPATDMSPTVALAEVQDSAPAAELGRAEI